METIDSKSIAAERNFIAHCQQILLLFPRTRNFTFMSESILKFNVSIQDFKALQVKHILLMAWSFRGCLTTSSS